MKNLSLLYLFALAGFAQAADFQLGVPFQDNMVLQCEMPVPVWGNGTSGSTVTVTIQHQVKTALVGADGAWRVVLDPLVPGGPEEMTVALEGKTISLKNVLVGEVWICSGQSNMAYTRNRNIFGSDTTLAEMVSQAQPEVRVCLTDKKVWMESTPEQNGDFTAQGFAFAVQLNRELKRPVGIIVRSKPGMPACRFVSQDMFLKDKDCTADFQHYLDNWTDALAQDLYAKSLENWTKVAANKKALGQPEPAKPPFPVKPTLKSFRFEEELRLLEPYYGFAIRGVLWDQGEGLSGVPGVPQDHIIRALINGWRQAWGLNFPFISVQKPSGGGCAFDSSDPTISKTNPFKPLPAEPLPTADGLERAAHVKIMQVPGAVLSTTSDLVPGVHPVLKSIYAARDVRVALGFVYGKPLEYLGPVYKSYTRNGDKVSVTFDHVGKGLVFRNGTQLQGFCLAGQDQVFHWADATIENNTVTVTSALVPHPVAIRYAWGSDISWANLFNLDGLPALTFRTDNWEAPTTPAVSVK